MKECRRCFESLPKDSFAKNPANKDGLHSYCTPCRRAYARDRYKAQVASSPSITELNRGRARQYRYGITDEQYKEMLEGQNNSCAVCHVEFSDNVKPKIDHDHNCCPGKVTCGLCVRGILCQGCVALAVRVETRFSTFNNMFEYLSLHLGILGAKKFEASNDVSIKMEEVN